MTTLSPPPNFIEQIIEKDLKSGKHKKITTRFPPEPNGYLHIGHAKSICLNFGLAKKFSGITHLRFDDTNPEAEDTEYIESIQEDVRWMGFEWGDNLFHASDYFDELYDLAHKLIDKGLAYVCSLPQEKMREYRGTLTEPGKNSPDRDRSLEENKELFAKMKAGDFADGELVLRAKIDMASPNMNMRDPVIYRIKKMYHPHVGDNWCIYPTYDFTHGLSDAIERITHSLCTLEFEDHRPLYDWFIKKVDYPCHPQQIEFARLNLEYMILSKRKLMELVQEGHVNGWDDPRMPTLCGLRRRGYTPHAIRHFCERIGLTKKDSLIEMNTLENSIREDLDVHAPRTMAVLDPIKVTITNYPEDQEEIISKPCHPKRDDMGFRKIPFSKEIYIERDDFMEQPPKKFFRLTSGGRVRLRYAYVIECHEVIKDDTGKIIELKCTYDKDTFAGKTPEGQKKVKGIIHWVSAKHAVTAQVHLYDRLFNVPNPLADKQKKFTSFLNPQSLVKLKNAKFDPSFKDGTNSNHYQFERLGYFFVDPKAPEGTLIFNRTVSLKDTWAKKVAGNT